MYLHRAGSKEIYGKNKRSANRPNRLVRAYESGYIFSVNRAVQIQRERYANEKFKFNSQLSGENIKKYCKLNKEEQHLMEKIYTTMDLSIRAYDKIIKVARTIADLKQHEKIQQGDIAEAVSYRPVLFK